MKTSQIENVVKAAGRMIVDGAKTLQKQPKVRGEFIERTRSNIITEAELGEIQRKIEVRCEKGEANIMECLDLSRMKLPIITRIVEEETEKLLPKEPKLHPEIK